MINQNYTAGLQVETLIPAPFSNHIDIHSEIRVRFNSELIVKSSNLCTLFMRQSA